MHRLYYSPGACSFAVHAVLEEIGAPYELETVWSVGEKRRTDSPEYLAVNPKGRVPALTGVPGRVGDATDLLTEAPAILVYLAKANPQAGLLPSDVASEARCLEWMNWISSNVHSMSYGQIWRSERFVPDERDYPAVIEKGHANVLEQYAYIERVLSDGREWAVPDGFTVVDPYLLVFYMWGGRIGLDMREDYPAWTRILARVALRDGVRRAMEQEKLTLP